MNKRTILAVVLGIGIILLVDSLLKEENAKNGNTSVESTQISKSNEFQNDSNLTKAKVTPTYVTGEGNQYKIYDGNFFSVHYPNFLEVFENMTADVPYVIFEGIDDTDGIKTKRAERIEVFYGKDVKKFTEKDILNKYTTTFNQQKFIGGNDPLQPNMKILWVQGNGYALKITTSTAYNIHVDLKTLELK